MATGRINQIHSTAHCHLYFFWQQRWFFLSRAIRAREEPCQPFCRGLGTAFSRESLGRTGLEACFLISLLLSTLLHVSSEQIAAVSRALGLSFHAQGQRMVPFLVFASMLIGSYQPVGSWTGGSSQQLRVQNRRTEMGLGYLLRAAARVCLRHTRRLNQPAPLGARSR